MAVVNLRGPLVVLLLSVWTLTACVFPMDQAALASGDRNLPALRLTEIEPGAGGSWTDENGVARDWIELMNVGPGPIELSAFGLGETKDPDRAWRFPSRSLGPGERIVVAASSEDRRPRSGVLHTSFSLSSAGGQVVLWQGDIRVETVPFPALFDDQSYSRFDAGWSVTNAPTPAASNQSAVLDPEARFPLRIQEVQSSNGGLWLDETGASPDWVELVNTGPAPVDLGDYSLGASKNLSEAWKCPGRLLAPGERILIAASGTDKRDPASVFHATFHIDSQGDSLYLWVGTVLVDRVIVPALFGDQSYALLGNVWEITNVPSPGGPNSPALAEPGLAYPLRITEVQLSNQGVWTDDGGKTSDWFEVTNTGPGAVDLGSYAVGKTGKAPLAWAFPSRVLAPGERIVVAASGENRRPARGDLHTDFTLSSEGESLYLWTGTVVVDRVQVPVLGSGQSYSRFDSGWEPTSTPSPGAPNLEGIAEPGFSSAGGLFTDPDLQVRISGAGTVRYTLDGSTPDLSSPVLADPLLTLTDPDPADGLPGGVVVSARLERDGRLGPVAVRSFLFYPPGAPGLGKVAVISLAGKAADLVDGPDGLLGRNHDLYADIEVETHWDLFESADRGPDFSASAGTRLFGAASRGFNQQKSLALMARKEYGTARFNYPFFPGLTNDRGREITSFDSLVLRDGGNDSGSTMLRDVLMTGLMEGTAVDFQAYRPVALFANGRYWGFYQLREKVNEDFLSSHHPAIAGKSMDLLATYSQVLSGSDQDFKGLLAYLETHSPSQAEVWAKVASWIDVDQFTDYQIAEVYFANTDWPSNNIKYWRTRGEGGLWRWILYDTDFGFGLVEPAGHDTLAYATEASSTGTANTPLSTLLFRRLLENTDYQARFTARFQELLNSRFSPAAVSTRIDALAAEARDELLARHWKRWSDTGRTSGYPGWTSWDNLVEGLKSFARDRQAFLLGILPGHFDPVIPVRHDGTGLKGEYFRGDITLAGTPFLVRTDPLIHFGGAAATTEWAPGLGTENFSVRWTGTLRSSLTGDVKLILTGDDGHRLWLDGTLLINEWYGQGATPHQATVSLEAGRSYNLKVEYYQGTGGSEVLLEWAKGPFREVIPASQFFPAE